MKKLLLFLLVLAGGVSTASATDYSIGASEGDWIIKGQMTTSDNGQTYSYIINLPANYDNYLFTIFEGTTIKWENAYRPNGADGNWGVDSNNTPTMKKGVNNHVLSFPVNSTIARALKIDFTPSDGSCTITRLIAVASGYNRWSTETDYLEETTRGSNIYSGSVILEKESEDVNDGFQFVGINGAALKYYSYKADGGWIDINQDNATVTKDGVYNLTANFSNWKWVNPTLVTVPASVGTYGKATLCSEYALDFTGIENVQAYTITSSDKATGDLTKNQVTGKVPANTGLYIEGEAGQSANIPTTICTTSAGSNMLVGVTSSTNISQIDGSNTNYILTVNKDGGNVATPKFFKVNTAGNTVGANKAYLQIPTANAAREYFWFDDEATGINAAKVSQPAGEIFDLQGRRVAQPTKGLYIVNGKKFFAK